MRTLEIGGFPRHPLARQRISGDIGGHERTSSWVRKRSARGVSVMAKRFSRSCVEALTCPVGSKDTLVFDGELRGFGVRVSAAGSKTFLVQYNGPGGVKRRVPIGTFGVL